MSEVKRLETTGENETWKYLRWLEHLGYDPEISEVYNPSKQTTVYTVIPREKTA